MKRAALSLLLIALLLAVPAAGTAHILRVSDGSYVSMEEMIADLQTVRLVFMGELHDDDGHHHAQLQVIGALREAGMAVAVGLEMFRSDSQGTLDGWVAGKMSERDFLKVYRNNWSMWPSYKRIFRYARKNRLPMVGLNISREITQQVARNGFASLSERQTGELPMVRCDVDASYQEYMRRVLGGHAHNGSQFLHFCEAQMLWDTVMAETLLDYLSAHPEHVIVVLAGSGHAWKYGIPEQIRRRSKVPFRVLLPEIPGRISERDATAAEADYLMLGLDEAPLH